MKNKILSLAVAFACLVVICAGAAPAKQEKVEGKPERGRRVRHVVIVQGDKPAKVSVGQIVRVQGSIPSGMGEISVKTEGPVRLVATNDVTNIVDGHTRIGAQIREFEVRAQKKGKAKVIITIDNKIQKTTDTKEFSLEIE